MSDIDGMIQRDLYRIREVMNLLETEGEEAMPALIRQKLLEIFYTAYPNNDSAFISRIRGAIKYIRDNDDWETQIKTPPVKDYDKLLFKTRSELSRAVKYIATRDGTTDPKVILRKIQLPNEVRLFETPQIEQFVVKALTDDPKPVRPSGGPSGSSSSGSSRPVFKPPRNLPSHIDVTTVKGEGFYQGTETLVDMGFESSIYKITNFFDKTFKYDSLYRKMRASPPKTCLITLPRGSNQKNFAKVLSRDFAMRLYRTTGLKLSPTAFGENENLSLIYDNAKLNAPALIHVSEADTFIKQGKVGKFLRKTIKKINTERHKVIVLFTTTEAPAEDQISYDVFKEVIEITEPNSTERKTLFTVHSQNLELGSDVDFEDIGSRTPGYGIEEITNVIEMATNFAGERQISPVSVDDRTPTLLMRDFQNAISRIKPGSVTQGLSSIPNVTWDDVGGLFDIKQEVIETIVRPLRYPDIYQKFGIARSAGIMLYGPPGTGKTLIAKAIANEASANFIGIKSSDIFDKYLGESEKNVTQLFARARKMKPCVVFIDEFEGLGSKRGGSETTKIYDKIVTLFLLEMDGFGSRDGIYFLAATNRLDVVDEAFLRPGRFDKKIRVNLPTKDERENILGVHLRKLEQQGVQIDSRIDTSDVAERTEGFSGADLAMVVKETASIAVKDYIGLLEQGAHEGLEPAIKQVHMNQALKKIRPYSEII